MPSKDFLADAKPIAPTQDFLADAQPVNPAPQPTMSAGHGQESWLDNAESDLRHGGSSTFIGRGLGYLQGRGDKGYTGLESGVSPETANFMGSVPLGAAKMAQGVNEYWHGHPITGGLKALGGELQMATIPGSFVAPEAVDAGLDAIPSTARAGKMLETIRNEAQDVPVTMSQSGPQFSRFKELTQAGGRNSKPFTMMQKRIESGEPLMFPEARDFYTNIGDVTSPTKLQRLMGRGMKPNMLRQGVNARRAMNEDLTSAAGTINRGEDYSNAMREYANAMKLKKAARVGGLLAAGEAARRTGLLGNWIHRTALNQ